MKVSKPGKHDIDIDLRVSHCIEVLGGHELVNARWNTKIGPSYLFLRDAACSLITFTARVCVFVYNSIGSKE